MHTLLSQSDDGNLMAFARGPFFEVLDLRSLQFIILEEAQEKPPEESAEKPKKKKKKKKNKKIDPKQNRKLIRVVRIIKFSPCNKYIFVATDDKILRLWDCCNGKRISRISIDKKAVSACFTPETNQILVSDKYGEVYFYKLPYFEESKLALMHFNSVVNDLLITPPTITNEKKKFLVTCDGDGKIRVSLYPHTHTIENYCFGYKAFVTSLAIVTVPGKANKHLLVSGGNERNIRLFDYATGEMLHSVQIQPMDSNTKSMPTITTTAHPNSNLDTKTVPSYNSESNEYNPYVSHLITNHKKNIVVVVVDPHQCLYIFKIIENNEKYKLVLSSSLKTPHIPSAIMFDHNDKLWVMYCQAYCNNDNECIFYPRIMCFKPSQTDVDYLECEKDDTVTESILTVVNDQLKKHACVSGVKTIAKEQAIRNTGWGIKRNYLSWKYHENKKKSKIDGRRREGEGKTKTC